MADFQVGDIVRVAMPRGRNTRGVMGVHVMFTTSPEAKFDGAVGVITRIDDDSALANDPPVLIADEPTGNLDSKSAADVLPPLKEQVEQALAGEG